MKYILFLSCFLLSSCTLYYQSYKNENSDVIKEFGICKYQNRPLNQTKETL